MGIRLNREKVKEELESISLSLVDLYEIDERPDGTVRVIREDSTSYIEKLVSQDLFDFREKKHEIHELPETVISIVSLNRKSGDEILYSVYPILKGKDFQELFQTPDKDTYVTFREAIEIAEATIAANRNPDTYAKLEKLANSHFGRIDTAN